MADDINPARRAELLAAIAVLEPQIRGLQDLMGTSISGDLKNAIQHQIDVRTHRHGLLVGEIATLDQVNMAQDALLADGYPTLDTSVLESRLFQELTGEESDLDAAVAVFGQQATIAVGTPTFTPQPEPAAPGP